MVQYLKEGGVKMFKEMLIFGHIRDDITILQCYFNLNILERAEGVTAHLG